MAGNGPVFNAGERVEANTSTVWTYSDVPRRLGRRPGSPGVRGADAGADAVRARRGAADARRRPGCTRRACRADAVCCCRPACWSTSRSRPPVTSRHPAWRTAWSWPTSGCCGGCWCAGRRPADGRVAWRRAGRNAVGRGFTAALAFVAGLSVLVRPELALIGGVALVMMLVAASGWRRRLLIVVAGGLLPVGVSDLPDGLLRAGGARHRDRQGRLGRPSGRRGSSIWPTSTSPMRCGSRPCC